MILLDTVTFLWIITNSPKLSKKAKATYLNPDNQIYLSSVSVWEITVKYQLGRLPLPAKPEKFIPEQRTLHDIQSLSLTETDTLTLATLPPLHQDPFDRMLVCQALNNHLTILTPDELIHAYPVNTKW